MTVYVDDARIQASVRNGTRTITSRWSHLMADSTSELLAFAHRLSLSPRWIQYRGQPYEHFDVTDAVRRRALAMGAVPISYGREGAALTEAKRLGQPFDVEEARLHLRAQERAWAMARVLGVEWHTLHDTDRKHLLYVGALVDGLQPSDVETELRRYSQETAATPLFVRVIPALARACVLLETVA